MKRVAVLLAEGFEEVEAFTVVDLLRRSMVYVDTISITEEYMVRGSHGINVQTEDLFDEVNFAEFDMLVLPGGGAGARNLEAHEGVKKVVEDFCENEKFVGAICAAPAILGNLGLLKGRRATCYPSVEDQLQGAVVVKTPVIQDGNIITSRGFGTAISFGLKLVEVLFDKFKVEELAADILYLQ